MVLWTRLELGEVVRHFALEMDDLARVALEELEHPGFEIVMEQLGELAVDGRRDTTAGLEGRKQISRERGRLRRAVPAAVTGSGTEEKQNTQAVPALTSLRGSAVALAGRPTIIQSPHTCCSPGMPGPSAARAARREREGRL